MGTWGALLLGAVLVVVVAGVADLRLGLRRRRPTWSVARIGVGVALTLATAGLGGLLASVESEPVPEQFGVAVVVDGVSSSTERGSDLGLFVAARVIVEDCDDRVRVRLTVNPTAEFWIDHRAALRREAHLSIGIPDDDIELVEVLRGQEETLPLPRSGLDLGAQEQLPVPDVEVVNGISVVRVDVPDWGRTFDPVTVVFEAGWTRDRSRLGGCFVQVPALTGLPTMLTAARLLDRASGEPDTVPPGPLGAGSLFLVSSVEPEWYANYDPSLEITRGVATIDIADFTVDESRSLPAPSTNINGVPAWTCRSSILSTYDFASNLTPGSDAPDYLITGDGSGGAFGGARAEAINGQSSCGSLLALDDPGYGSRRDLVLIVIGALFSLGIELILSGVRRRDPSEQ